MARTRQTLSDEVIQTAIAAVEFQIQHGAIALEGTNAEPEINALQRLFDARSALSALKSKRTASPSSDKPRGALSIRSKKEIGDK